MKIVERTGQKITDILHKSNAWENSDCEREDCLICKSTGDEGKKGQCKKRNIVYETYCITCWKEERLENELKTLGENCNTITLCKSFSVKMIVHLKGTIKSNI